MKKYTALLLFIMVIFSLSGQDNNINLPKIIPPSPSAYQLGEYGQIPVGYFTGNIKPEIPLSTYNTANLSVPVFLNYHSNGIKVDQLTSNVGLGWNLNSGGVITRVVRGLSDEKRTTPIPQNIIGNYSSDAAINYFYDMGSSITPDIQPDSEVDIFAYNFLGHAGQFVLDHNKNIVILTPSGLTIVNYEGGFLITDTQGIKYYFLDTESSRFRSYGGEGHSLWVGPEITGWYLSKVVHPKGDEIYFNYSYNGYTYDVGNHQSITVSNPTYQASCPNKSGTGPGYSISPIVTNMSGVAGLKLDSITSNRPGQGKIEFSYEYLSAINSTYLISGLKYLDASNKINESATLTYLTTSNKRTFLTSVTFSDPNKKYSFEYDSPESLPKRLSFSQDYWGYNNGKKNTYFFPNPSKIDIKPGGFGLINVGADKEPDSTYSKYGMLKKITYPTKGFTSFEYEENTYHGTKDILPPLERVALPVETNGSTFRATNSKDLINITYDQKIDLNNKSIQVNDYECNPDLVPPHHVLATVTIENLTTDQSDILYERRMDGDLAVGNTFNFSPGDMQPNLYMYLRKNCDYRISISIGKPCLLGGLGFSYRPGEIQVVPAEIPQGGVRINKIVNQSAPGKALEIKNIYYGKKETPTQSSGIKGVNPWYFTKRTDRISCDAPCYYVDLTYAVLNSSSVRNLYNSSVLSTRYRYVTVSIGDDFENGGEEYEYYVGEDFEGKSILGDPIEGAPRVNSGWDDGLQKQVSRFKVENGGFVSLYEKTDTYTRDSGKNKTVYGFNIRKKFNLTCTYTQPDLQNLENLDITEHKVQQNWFYKESSTEIQYDENGEKPVNTITNYYYDNPNHFQLTRTTFKNSKGNVITTKTLYPQDISNRTAAENKLINRNRIAEPIQTETYQDGVKLYTKHNVFGDTWGNNQVLLKEIRASKGTVFPVPRIRYHKYDSYGNPLELSLINGPHITYLWGYNGQYPVAKVENTTYADVIATGVNLSVFQNTSSTEAARITELNKIRNHATMANAQVTTYTYKPLIGISTITDPRGEKTTYTYNTFNRLQFIKDETNKLLEEYKYHYKN